MKRAGALSLGHVSLGFGVFSLCMLGIVSRPHFDLATFWPANAFLLGMMIRFPKLAGGWGWIRGAVGFFMADMVTDSELVKNLALNGGNLAAIAAGYSLLRALEPEDRRLERPRSILFFLRAIFVASLVAGLAGMMTNPLVFGGSWKEGFFFWSATELANYMAFLPVLLTWPAAGEFRWRGIRQALRDMDPLKFLPLLAFLASALASVLIGGPGAVAFPVPALLWCALTYRLFTVSCLAFAFGAWTFQAIHLGFIAVGSDLASRELLISTRVGVTLIALAPLVVGSVMTARNELVARLRFLADRDALTELRNRRAFFEDGTAALTSITDGLRSVAVMMLDIDHFKSINDTYGHDAGDKVLSDFARILENNVRDGDIVGRIGGEEFAIVLPECRLAEAMSVAQRIGDVLRSTNIVLEDGRLIRVTVSIGLNIKTQAMTLADLLAHADAALYRAKDAGRDRCVLA
ncbi:MAG: diguanylate cyclase [Sphingobium sp.]